MKKNHVLIDYENVQPAGIEALEHKHFHVMVFVGASQAKVNFDVASVLQQMGERASYIKITGAVNWGNGKAYFFRGSQYVRYDIASDRVDPGYPQPISAKTWPGLIWTDGIDAAVNWGNGKAYFFKGNQYIRYDIKGDRADSGYPKPINAQTWRGMIWTDGINDVVAWNNGKAYFFRAINSSSTISKLTERTPGIQRTLMINHGRAWCGKSITAA